MNIQRIDASAVGILIIDVQPAFVNLAFPDGGPILDSLMLRFEHLLMLADWLDLPTIATSEIPTADNGELPDRLRRVFPTEGKKYDKSFFDCSSEPDIEVAIRQTSVRQWAVAGAETDVCVLQSTLGLIEEGYEVFLLEDCLFTSEQHPGPALRRMYQAGAIPTTLKTLTYELLGCVPEIPWYPEGWAMKTHPDAKPFPDAFIPPEQWPAWSPSL